MTHRSHRTDTSFFVVVALLLVSGYVWAIQKKPAPAPTPTTSTSSTPTTIQTTQAVSTAAPTWSGELILLRDNQLIGRTAAGTERIIYSAPTATRILTSSALTSGHEFLQVSGTASTVVDVDISSGTTTTRSDLTTLALVAPRPTTQSVVRAVFSNAERDFGSKIILTNEGVDKTIYQLKDSVTDIAWRSDGDVLAIGTQTGVVVLTMTSGDATTTTLSSSVRSLSWAGADILAVLANGSAMQITPGKTPVTLSEYGSIGRDLLSISTNQFVWLSGESGSSDIMLAIGDPAKFQSKELQPVVIAKAAHIVGVYNAK